MRIAAASRATLDSGLYALRPLATGFQTLLPLLLLILVAACAHPAGTGQHSATKGIRTFEVKGVVQELGLDRGTALIRHEAIPGYMPRMTMEFTVLDPRELEGVVAGDAIVFTLHASDTSHWIESIRRAGVSRIDQRVRPEPLGAKSWPRLKQGEPMPDHELITEHGRAVRFSDFRGHALAFTFIFTRCPLPDFCPRMSKHFERARALLNSQEPSTTNWQFLSISFDPDFDTPAVLARHARLYRGDDTNRWLFAVASSNVLSQISLPLDLAISRDRGAFSHNLRTVVLDTQGRIHRQFSGNQWTAEELAESMLQAARTHAIDRPN